MYTLIYSVRLPARGGGIYQHKGDEELQGVLNQASHMTADTRLNIV